MLSYYWYVCILYITITMLCSGNTEILIQSYIIHIFILKIVSWNSGQLLESKESQERKETHTQDMILTSDLVESKWGIQTTLHRINKANISLWCVLYYNDHIHICSISAQQVKSDVKLHFSHFFPWTSSERKHLTSEKLLFAHFQQFGATHLQFHEMLRGMGATVN